jgi:alpha,alpha-trehalose phosphorylase
MEQRFFPRYLAQSETFFALANGYLGMRGVFNAGHPAAENGTFINGFFEHRPLVYGEKGFGFPRTSEAMLNVTDGKVIQLYVDGDLFDLTQADFIEFKRYLDLRSATLNQDMVWEMPSGKRIAVKSTRLVSFGRRHTAAVSYEVTVLDADARLTLVSALITPEGAQVEEENDPRRAQGFQRRVLHPVTQRVDGYRGMLCHGTRASKLNLACGMDHVVETECEYSHDTKCSEDNAAIVFSVDAKANRPFRLVKFLGYHSAGADIPVRELCFSVELTLDRALRRGFDRLLSDQREYMEDFWHRSDVRISGGPTEVQLVLRWNLFQLLQTSARGEGAGIPAKGLTGEAYEGHHFWDAEIYVLPFLIYTAPRCARSVLKYRYGMLDQARERARELGHKGAMFPWRTITGQESSAYYAAGTAQYHINADIAYALKKYVTATNDQQFLLEYGAEILVETARLWFDLGFYSETHDGGFCINGVTGPDEYTTVVNNNYFTNLMAQENLCYAAAVIEAMQRDHPDEYGELVERTGLQFAEVYDWKDAAQQMYLPYDRKLGIHPQDEDFLEKEAWDFDGTPDSKYPLLLHFHPLNVYRHQVIKQADTVLAMFLLGNKFSAEEKKRNFDYYDPLTTGDSSLSVCVQSIVAAEIGYLDKALEYFMFAVAMDLGDVAGNVKDGAHIASTGGTWMATVYGFGGFRDYDGEFSFHPRLPKDWERLRFPLTIQGNLLEVDITHDNTTYTLSEGEGLTFRHQKQQVELRGSEPVSVTNRPPPSP